MPVAPYSGLVWVELTGAFPTADPVLGSMGHVLDQYNALGITPLVEINPGNIGNDYFDAVLPLVPANSLVGFKLSNTGGVTTPGDYDAWHSFAAACESLIRYRAMQLDFGKAVPEQTILIESETFLNNNYWNAASRYQVLGDMARGLRLLPPAKYIWYVGFYTNGTGTSFETQVGDLARAIRWAIPGVAFTDAEFSYPDGRSWNKNMDRIKTKIVGAEKTYSQIFTNSFSNGWHPSKIPDLMRGISATIPTLYPGSTIAQVSAPLPYLQHAA